MPLILAPSFDDHTRAEVEAHLDMVRVRRIAAAMEYAQSKMTKLETEEGSLGVKLSTNYERLGKALERLEKDMLAVETYLEKCTMLRSEMDLVHDRITLARGQ
jgi:hypothetical protein